MKYIKILVIIFLTTLTLTSCSNNTEEYQIQVKEELTEYLYSVETATTGPRYETNYEYAEEVIEEYSLKTTKRRHVKSNIKKGKKVLDKIILPKEKSDEMLEVYCNVYNYSIDQLHDRVYGYVIGVFGDAVAYYFHNGMGESGIKKILNYEFISGGYDIIVYHNGESINLMLSYLYPEKYNGLFENGPLTEENVGLMYELFKSWIISWYKERGVNLTYDYLLEINRI